MKAIRSSPVTRVTAWLLTSALIAPMALVGHAARAQDQQVLKIVIADTENKAPGASSDLGINTTAALYNEFAASGLGKFNVVSTTEVRNEAVSLGMKVPSNPAAPFNFDANEWLRVAKSLGADSIVNSAVSAVKLGGKSVGVKVVMTVELRDVGANIPTNGASGEASETPRPGEPAVTGELLNKGVEDAALQAVRSVVSHQLISATVLNINDKTVILNAGLRDGIAIGDKIQVLRDAGNGSKYPVGDLLIARAYATDSEAEVVHNVGGIRPEDIGRVIYAEVCAYTSYDRSRMGALPGQSWPGEAHRFASAVYVRNRWYARRDCNWCAAEFGELGRTGIDHRSYCGGNLTGDQCGCVGSLEK